MWNLPDGQQSIQTLTSATSPFQTFVLDLTKKDQTNDDELRKLGINRKKKLSEYVKLFHKILEEKLLQPSGNAMETSHSSPTTSSTTTITDGGGLLHYCESMASHNMTNPEYSFGNTTTLSSDTSMQQPPSTTLTHDTVSPRSTSSHESMSSANLSPIGPYSQNSPHQLENCSMDLGTTNDDICTDMDECHAYYLPLLFLVNIDSEFSFADDSDSTVPKAKAFHEYHSEDLHAVRCMSSFLYLVFRDPLANESTCFKAGFRTFDEHRQPYAQAIRENKRRYVTSFGMETCHYRYTTWFCMICFYSFRFLF